MDVAKFQGAAHPVQTHRARGLSDSAGRIEQGKQALSAGGGLLEFGPGLGQVLGGVVDITQRAQIGDQRAHAHGMAMNGLGAEADQADRGQGADGFEGAGQPGLAGPHFYFRIHRGKGFGAKVIGLARGRGEGRHQRAG